jgi:hypothetical protein
MWNIQRLCSATGEAKTAAVELLKPGSSELQSPQLLELLISIGAEDPTAWFSCRWYSAR